MADEQNPPAPDPDEWDRQLRDLTSGAAGAARFTEPSAAERARRAASRAARRTASQGSGQAARPAGPKPMSWRNARKARKLRQPVPEPGSDRGRPGAGRFRAGQPRGAGPGYSPRGGYRATAGDRLRPASRRARRIRSVARTIAILALFGAILYTLHALGFGPQSRGTGAQPPQRSRPSRHQPQAPGQAVPAFTAADPFAGSPAEHYASGAAGIVLPPARAVGGYPAVQVAAAYAKTKSLLVAAYLDPRTLSGGYPASFVRLLVPAQRSDFVRGLSKIGTYKSGVALSTRGWLTSFAPGSTVLVGSVVKVHGHLTAMRARDSGRTVLRVHADYLFVYPVQHLTEAFTRMRIVTRAVVDVDFADWTGSAGAFQAWWVGPGPSSAGARCGTRDGYVHPAFPAAAASGGVSPSGAPLNPYDQNGPQPKTCRPTTGT